MNYHNNNHWFVQQTIFLFRYLQDPRQVSWSEWLGISKFCKDPTLLHYLDKATVNSFLKTIAIYDTKLLMLLHHAKSLWQGSCGQISQNFFYVEVSDTQYKWVHYLGRMCQLRLLQCATDLAALHFLYVDACSSPPFHILCHFGWSFIFPTPKIQLMFLGKKKIF